jgi:hypothetical protein
MQLFGEVPVLRSLKTIRKESTRVAVILRRSTPDPRLGASVELSGRDACSLRNLIRVGKALSSQCLATEQAPRALLQIELAGPFGNEHLLDT